MAVVRYETKDGTRWRVRWKEPDGGWRSVTKRSKRDALAIDADVKARRYRGDALPRPGRDTLADAYDEWLRLRAPRLATHTQRVYKLSWQKHIQERGFDAHRLSDLVANPMLLEELTAEMREDGVGPAAQRKTLVVLSSVLTACVRWKKIPTNPVWRMPKPTTKRERHPHPFPPLVVERIRLRMMRRDTRDQSGLRPLGDACLVSLLSYAGLRPGEALALTIGDIGTRTLAVDKAIADGVVGPTKTGRARSVPLSQALAHDLKTWRVESGDPPSTAFVFPGNNGNPWSRAQANNWRARVWRPVLKDLATQRTLEQLGTAIPYDCRGSFVSLHLRAGASPLEVARWAGHSPQVMFDRYANVIDELVGEPILPVDEQIRRARDAVAGRSRRELDELVAELFERPTLAAAGGKGAAKVFYEPAGPS
ncbi:MAG: tyrosine-type recombinase/integrase [Solirubrobacterales bacterium]